MKDKIIMKSKAEIGGVIVPLVTPLTPGEQVDEAALQKCVNHVIEGGVDGVFINSTTGEYAALRDAEREHNLQVVSELAAGRATVYAGISDTGTARVLQNIDVAAKYPVDAFVLMPPLVSSGKFEKNRGCY
ncbi:MAG: hypothetical protein D6814_01810 [Calditrichaeota bacterium]|nr:MAG: hypothetical protein D6814_01810 [Calditrichota bacterium]